MNTPTSKTPEQWNWVYALICQGDPAVHGQLLPTPQNMDFIKQVQDDIRNCEVEPLQRRVRELEQHLANELGIDKAERNAGDDPSKEYWIGTNQQCYESIREAIDAAITHAKDKG